MHRSHFWAPCCVYDTNPCWREHKSFITFKQARNLYQIVPDHHIVCSSEFLIQVCRKLPISSQLQLLSRAPRSLDLLFFLLRWCFLDVLWGFWTICPPDNFTLTIRTLGWDNLAPSQTILSPLVQTICPLGVWAVLPLPWQFTPLVAGQFSPSNSSLGTKNNFLGKKK